MDYAETAGKIRKYLEDKNVGEKAHEITDSEQSHIESLIRLAHKDSLRPTEEEKKDPNLVQYTAEKAEALRREICRFTRGSGYRWRRESTKWSDKEEKALADVFPFDRRDYVFLRRYYNAPIPPDRDFRRRQIITLLNNWAGEIDRAKEYHKELQDKLKDYTKI